MPPPVISASSSILGFKRQEVFEFQPAATFNPLTWEAIGLPSGVSIDTPASFSATGVAATDTVTATGNDFVNGGRVYFAAITGGAGLAANTVYFVRDKSGATVKLAATLTGAAIDFTSDISAGQLRRVSTGRVSGAIAVAGVYVVTLSASNADPATGSREFVFGVNSEIATTVGASDVAVEWEMDIESRKLQAVSSDGLGAWKNDDIFLVRLRFTKGEQYIDPSPTSLRVSLKELSPDPAIAVSSSFQKIGSGADAYFDILVDLSGDAVKHALDNYALDESTKFSALVEVQLEASVVFNAAATPIRISSHTASVQLADDQIA